MPIKNKTKYTCPNCGRDCRNPNALQLHMQGGKCKKEETEKKENQNHTGLSCRQCGGGLELLSNSNSTHKMAIKEGYTEYCVKCEEVY